MCHSSVIGWALAALDSELVAGRTVIEVGSYNVNGSVRPIIEYGRPASYLGVDMSAGPGVDLVAEVADLPAMFPKGFGLVVSTEMLEHVVDWRSSITALANLVEHGGTLAVSTRSPGFPYHPFPIDCWRYPVEDMHRILELLNLDVVSCVPDGEQPGVFAIAQKPKGWVLPGGTLDDLELPGP